MDNLDVMAAIEERERRIEQVAYELIASGELSIREARHEAELIVRMEQDR